MKTELYAFLLNANAIHWIGNIKWPVTGVTRNIAPLRNSVSPL